MKIIADAHIPFVKAYFSAYGELVLKPGRHITAADVKDADMLLVRSITQVDSKLLQGSNVKFVGSITAGADHLDTAWLDSAGILWRVAEGFNAPPVADYVVSVIAALQCQKLLKTQELKAAVIGVGNVGKRVAAYFQQLNMQVVLCDPLRAEAEPDFVSTSLDKLNDLDIISIHVPLTKSGPYPTQHFITADFLQRQKINTVLLNASRGAVLDSNTLLKHGQHLQWCLDVWEHEPNINKEVLASTTIATPHIAGYSVQSKIRGIDMIYRLACAAGQIQPLSISPIAMPTQSLDFEGETHDWRNVVLAVFNPIIITKMMKEGSITPERFDEMRNQFNYRHEFAFAHYDEVVLAKEDEKILQQLHIHHLNEGA